MEILKNCYSESSFRLRGQRKSTEVKVDKTWNVVLFSLSTEILLNAEYEDVFIAAHNPLRLNLIVFTNSLLF